MKSSKAKPSAPPAEPLPLGSPPAIEPIAWRYVAVIAGISLLGGAVRMALLNHPMRYDEAFAFLMFAAPNSARDWLNYLAPNNHVLHTLASHAAMRLGGDAPAIVRMPAFFAGVAIVPFAASLAVRLSGRRLAGICAAAMVATSSILVEYSTNARGYSAVCLAAIVMAISATSICRDVRRKSPWAIWTIVAAAGLFTIPVMLYPIGILTVVMILQAAMTKPSPPARRIFFIRLAFSLAGVAALTAVLYAPVVYFSGVKAIVANEFVTPIALSEVVGRLPGVAGETLAHWRRDTTIMRDLLIVVGLVAATLMAVRKRWLLPALPVASVVLLAAAALAHRVVPFPRVWLFLLPWLLASAAAGLAWAVELPISPKLRAAAKTVFVILLTAEVALAARYIAERPYLISEDPRTLVDADSIGRDIVELFDGRTAVASQVPAWTSLAYHSVLHSPRTFIRYESPRWSRVIVVVGHLQTLDGVIESSPGLAENYAPPRLWKAYPHAAVYITERKKP